MLVAYCRLCRLCHNLAEGGCLLSDFILRAVLGHVACRNLPWQGLYGVLPIWGAEPDRYSVLKSQLTKAALSSIECDNN